MGKDEIECNQMQLFCLSIAQIMTNIQTSLEANTCLALTRIVLFALK
jgi:hypothetical protein